MYRLEMYITCRLRSFALSAYILVSDVNLLDISLTSARNEHLLKLQPDIYSTRKRW
jgi:hypothetical protein